MKNLIIKDTGIGIRKEDLPRVFEKSYTGYNGRIYKKSTGIGLNLVKTTAENSKSRKYFFLYPQKCWVSCVSEYRCGLL